MEFFYEEIKQCLAFIITISITPTVGENIIATTKIRNNYAAIQSLIFPILR
jgi:hypothetical protein